MITFENFKASIIKKVSQEVTNNTTFLRIENQISIQLRDTKHNLIPHSECDVNVGSMVMQFEEVPAIDILQTVNSFLSFGTKKTCVSPRKVKSSDALQNLMTIDPAIGALLWLQEQKAKKSEVTLNQGDIDYDSLIDLLKSVS